MEIFAISASFFMNQGDKLFFDMMKKQDQTDLLQIKEKLSSRKFRYRYNQGLDSFVVCFNYLKEFCTKGDDEDWKRSLACGLCVFGNSVGINSKRLEYFLGKSKSTINQSLKKIGFDGCPKTKENMTELVEKIPYLGQHFNECRQWTVRISTEPNKLKKSSSQEIEIEQTILHNACGQNKMNKEGEDFYFPEEFSEFIIGEEDNIWLFNDGSEFFV